MVYVDLKLVLNACFRTLRIKCIEPCSTCPTILEIWPLLCALGTNYVDEF